MTVIVNMPFAEVLVFGVSVWQVGMPNRGVVVLVRMQGRQVFPLTQDLVSALPPVMRHMRMCMHVHNRLVSVIDVFRNVGPLANLCQQPPRR
jgi:hypothetical protein